MMRNLRDRVRNELPAVASPFDVEVLVHDLLDGTGIVGDVGITVDGVLDDGAGHCKVHHIHGHFRR